VAFFLFHALQSDKLDIAATAEFNQIHIVLYVACTGHHARPCHAHSAEGRGGDPIEPAGWRGFRRLVGFSWWEFRFIESQPGLACLPACLRWLMLIEGEEGKGEGGKGKGKSDRLLSVAFSCMDQPYVTQP